MNKFLSTIGLMGVGAILMGFAMFSMAPSLMVHEIKSPYGVDETVKRISDNALKQGWVVKKVMDMQKSTKKGMNKDIPATKVMKLGQGAYAYELTQNDETRFVAAMMPHSIAVYEKSDGSTYISTMNMGLMGSMFGGEVKRVMAKVQKDDDVILAFLKD